MRHDPNIFRDSSQVIQEVEDQLDRVLQKKFRDVDSELVERINREKEAARQRKEEIEREFEKEKTALADYRVMVRDFEEQRAGLLNEAREGFDRVLKFQAEIESLAKATVEEIRRVNEIQERLEALRAKTSERAAFLKDDLRERFGIAAEIMEEEPRPLSLNLDEELEKLKRIKELLAIESATASLGRVGGEAAREEDLGALDVAAAGTGPAIPEIGDLISGPAPASGADRAVPAPEPAPPAAEEEAAAAVESFRRTEPANGNGEIHYFQGDKTVIADPEKLLDAVDQAVEEGRRLAAKLGQTESPKDQFFIKQELINWQEGLRALFLRVIKMCERNAWTLPRYTAGVLDAPVLRRLLERLSMENWSNLEEFGAFAAAAEELRRAFRARTEPRLAYLLDLRRELEEN
ncbi:MAG TPA: hypothetical protein PLP83_01290 [Candidatus Aminicenantes bacterium]|nr:hypothetical protein [Candidatus Aminicenantes bacterium]